MAPIALVTVQTSVDTVAIFLLVEWQDVTSLAASYQLDTNVDRRALLDSINACSLDEYRDLRLTYLPGLAAKPHRLSTHRLVYEGTQPLIKRYPTRCEPAETAAVCFPTACLRRSPGYRTARPWKDLPESLAGLHRFARQYISRDRFRPNIVSWIGLTIIGRNIRHYTEANGKPSKYYNVRDVGSRPGRPVAQGPRTLHPEVSPSSEMSSGRSAPVYGRERAGERTDSVTSPAPSDGHGDSRLTRPSCSPGAYEAVKSSPLSPIESDPSSSLSSIPVARQGKTMATEDIGSAAVTNDSLNFNEVEQVTAQRTGNERESCRTLYGQLSRHDQAYMRFPTGPPTRGGLLPGEQTWIWQDALDFPDEVSWPVPLPCARHNEVIDALQDKVIEATSRYARVGTDSSHESTPDHSGAFRSRMGGSKRKAPTPKGPQRTRRKLMQLADTDPPSGQDAHSAGVSFDNRTTGVTSTRVQVKQRYDLVIHQSYRGDGRQVFPRVPIEHKFGPVQNPLGLDLDRNTSHDHWVQMLRRAQANLIETRHAYCYAWATRQMVSNGPYIMLFLLGRFRNPKDESLENVDLSIIRRLEIFCNRIASVDVVISMRESLQWAVDGTHWPPVLNNKIYNMDILFDSMVTRFISDPSTCYPHCVL